MDTEKVKVLLDVLETGSLSATAEKLGYTPSGVSRMMQSLESETGFTLLDRKKTGIEATDGCERLLPVMRELVYWADRYDEEARAVTGLDTGTVTVGMTYSYYYRYLSGIIARFNRLYPGITVKTVDDSSSNLVRALSEKKIDCCIVSKRDGDYRWIPLKDDPMTAWVPKGHASIAKGVYNIRGFEKEPYISIFGSEESDSMMIFDRYGIRPDIRYQTKDSYATYCMVEAGLGVCMMNNIEMADWNGEVVSLPVTPDQIIEIGLMAGTDESVSPAAKRFVDFIEEQER